MTEYLIYFNQQWVGDHTEEWFRGRGPLAQAVVAEMKAAGVYVFAGGLEEETARSTAPTPPVARWWSPTDRTSRPRSSWAGSPWWMWPMTRPPRCGRARSQRPAAGPTRFAASSRSPRPSDSIVELVQPSWGLLMLRTVKLVVAEVRAGRQLPVPRRCGPFLRVRDGPGGPGVQLAGAIADRCEDVEPEGLRRVSAFLGQPGAQG